MEQDRESSLYYNVTPMIAEASRIYRQEYEKKWSHESMTKPPGIQMISITPHLRAGEPFHRDPKALLSIQTNRKRHRFILITKGLYGKCQINETLLWIIDMLFVCDRVADMLWNKNSVSGLWVQPHFKKLCCIRMTSNPMKAFSSQAVWCCGAVDVNWVKKIGLRSVMMGHKNQEEKKKSAECQSENATNHIMMHNYNSKMQAWSFGREQKKNSKSFVLDIKDWILRHFSADLSVTC